MKKLSLKVSLEDWIIHIAAASKFVARSAWCIAKGKNKIVTDCGSQPLMQAQ